jgi:ankyrin repeat protein
MAAAEAGHHSSVSLLLQAGASVNLVTCKPLPSAFSQQSGRSNGNCNGNSNGSLSSAAGPAVNLGDARGVTPLMIAAQNAHSLTVKVLLGEYLPLLLIMRWHAQQHACFETLLIMYADSHCGNML